MSERQLRRRCRNLLRDLDIRPPLNVRQLCGRLAEHRGNPILLDPRPLPVPGPLGLWLAMDDGDHIVYQAETTRAHQDHIILHEVGHLIADHPSDELDDDLIARLFPYIDPALVRHTLRREGYDTDREREAETVATIVLQWASVLDPLAPGLSCSAGGRNMQDALGDRVGWL